MSQLDQSDVEALLAEAEALATDVSGAAPVPAAASPVPQEHRPACSSAPTELRRILNLEVPVIVQLAERQMTMREVLDLNVGAVIEFDRRFDAELALVCMGAV